MGRKLTRAAPGEAGFSLLELVVVVAVLSVLAVGASLAAVSRDRLPGDQRVFEQSFERASALAVHGRHSQGLLVTSTGITRLQKLGDEWMPTGKERTWRGRVTLQSNLPRTGLLAPNVVLLSNGEVSPFSIGFDGPSNTGTRCLHDGFSGLTCD